MTWKSLFQDSWYIVCEGLQEFLLYMRVFRSRDYDWLGASTVGKARYQELVSRIAIIYYNSHLK